MKEEIKTSKKYSWLLWLARIWSLPIILYSLILAIGYTSNLIRTGKADPYAVEDYPFIENIPPILMFLAAMGLIVAWRFEKIGGIINIIFCLATIPILLIQWPDTLDFRYAIPFILVMVVIFPGILFLLHWFKTKKP
jgi:hypothetical protein